MYLPLPQSNNIDHLPRGSVQACLSSCARGVQVAVVFDQHAYYIRFIVVSASHLPSSSVQARLSSCARGVKITFIFEQHAYNRVVVSQRHCVVQRVALCLKVYANSTSKRSGMVIIIIWIICHNDHLQY